MRARSEERYGLTFSHGGHWNPVGLPFTWIRLGTPLDCIFVKDPVGKPIGVVEDLNFGGCGCGIAALQKQRLSLIRVSRCTY